MPIGGPISKASRATFAVGISSVEQKNQNQPMEAPQNNTVNSAHVGATPRDHENTLGLRYPGIDSPGDEAVSRWCLKSPFNSVARTSPRTRDCCPRVGEHAEQTALCSMSS